MIVSLGVCAWQMVVLVLRAGRGDSDFGFLIRAAERAQTLGSGLYSTLEERTRWPCSIPPSALVVFTGLRELSPTTAGIVWAAINATLLAVGIACLVGIFRRLEIRREHFEGMFLWSAALLLVLSTGSIQTGQLSVLFVVCWLGYLWADGKGWHALAGAALALPAAMKFYPAGMLAVPLLLGSRRQAAWFFVALLVVLVAVPWIVYGHDAFCELWSSYIRNALGGQGDLNVIAWRFKPAVLRNQSLDLALLRYLTDQAEFQRLAPHVPHLSLPAGAVLLAANILRAAILAVSVWAGWRWLRRARPPRHYAALGLMAFWTSAMYLALPEAKGRYAVYAFAAFLPLLASIAQAASARRFARAAAVGCLVAFCALLVMGLPVVLQAFSVGLLGPVLLWGANWACLRSDRRFLKAA